MMLELEVYLHLNKKERREKMLKGTEYTDWKVPKPSPKQSRSRTTCP